ncbi:MAG: leucine-rich repeat domain-containing protein [Acidobacteriota bacterium]|nr:leucine-rich repeat domain-containing protein [Acidobacteriota bacterium]
MSVDFPKITHHCRQRFTGSLLTLTLSLALLATPEQAGAQIVAVCDRTPEVRDEIVKLVPEVSDCADVTEAHLAAIEGEFFHGGWNYILGDWAGGPFPVRAAPPQVEELRAGDFSGLSSLEVLYLDRTPLASLPVGVFAGLSSLKELHLERTQLSTLPVGVFAGLSSLRYLNLFQSQLRILPEGVFSGLSSLKGLYLFQNQLSILPEKIFAGLSSLEELHLANNQPASLPEGVFTGLSSLERLILTNNHLDELPQGIFLDLASLKELDLNKNDLTSLPVNVFSSLSLLERLKLNHNLLSTLSRGAFTGLSSLTSLSVQGNRLDHLPDGAFSGLSSLEELKLSFNQLTRLPVGVFSGLATLKTLSLSTNQLTRLPIAVFAGLFSLERLSLRHNQLVELRAGTFAGLSALNLLDLFDNQLADLPAELFSGLFALRTLFLGRNQLTHLPAGIFSGLSNLGDVRAEPRADPLAIRVSLERVGRGQFKAKAHTGAPRNTVLTVSVVNGVINGGSNSITIPPGSMESSVVSVSRHPRTSSAVSVDIDSYRRNHQSYSYPYLPGLEPVMSPDLPLVVLEPGVDTDFELTFAHFGNGTSIRSELVLVNVGSLPLLPAIFFYDKAGHLIVPSSVVDVRNNLYIRSDGGLSVWTAIPSQGEITISTHGRGELVTGSVRVVAAGPMGGVLRFDGPDIGVAGVGSSPALQDIVFPVRRQPSGVNTGAAIHSLERHPTIVNCQLMQDGEMLEETAVLLAANGQSAWFIDEMFSATETSSFVGSVRCTTPRDELFTGVALEMDFQNRVFTTLPVVPIPSRRTQDYTQLHFPHFANGSSITSDLVLMNVAAGPIRPTIYFYDGAGRLTDPESVVDVGEDLQVRVDGALTIRADLVPLGELTISTHGRGDLVTGSVRVIADGPIGGFLRFDNPEIGVTGVGASQAVQAAIFPARHQAGGIRTGTAIRNLKEKKTQVTCQLMQDGIVLEEKKVPLASNGQTTRLVDELFPESVTSDFEGSVRCTVPNYWRFGGIAVEMDTENRIFTTLPLVPFRQ